ncbi:hypothetical protein MJM83_15405, partial [Salmonella enterica subsp. enterica serovar Montevideo]|nr:hypothetical protein [Salmonella enterica subsp. enterica serovar Montevideo]
GWQKKRPQPEIMPDGGASARSGLEQVDPISAAPSGNTLPRRHAGALLLMRFTGHNLDDLLVCLLH